MKIFENNQVRVCVCVCVTHKNWQIRVYVSIFPTLFLSLLSIFETREQTTFIRNDLIGFSKCTNFRWFFVRPKLKDQKIHDKNYIFNRIEFIVSDWRKKIDCPISNVTIGVYAVFFLFPYWILILCANFFFFIYCHKKMYTVFMGFFSHTINWKFRRKNQFWFSYDTK